MKLTLRPIICQLYQSRLVGGASSLAIVTAAALKIYLTLTFNRICMGIFPLNTSECIFCQNYFIYEAEVFCNLPMFYPANAEAPPEM